MSSGRGNGGPHKPKEVRVLEAKIVEHQQVEEALRGEVAQLKHDLAALHARLQQDAVPANDNPTNLSLASLQQALGERDCEIATLKAKLEGQNIGKHSANLAGMAEAHREELARIKGVHETLAAEHHAHLQTCAKDRDALQAQASKAEAACRQEQHATEALRGALQKAQKELEDALSTHAKQRAAWEQQAAADHETSTAELNRLLHVLETNNIQHTAETQKLRQELDAAVAARARAEEAHSEDRRKFEVDMRDLQRRSAAAMPPAADDAPSSPVAAGRKGKKSAVSCPETPAIAALHAQHYASDHEHVLALQRGIDALHSDFHDATARLEATVLERDQLLAQTHELKAELQAMQPVLAAQAHAVQALESNYRSVHDSVKHVIETREALLKAEYEGVLQTQRDMASKRIQELTDETNAARKLVTEHRQKLMEMQTRFNDQAAKYDTLTKSLESVHQLEMVKLRTMATALHEENARLNGVVAEHQQRVQALETRHRAAQEAETRRLAETASSSITTMEDSVRDYSSRLRGLEERYKADLESLHRTRESQLEVARGESAAQKQRILDLESQLHAAQAALEAAHSVIHAHEQESATQLAALIGENAELRDALADAQRTLLAIQQDSAAIEQTRDADLAAQRDVFADREGRLRAEFEAACEGMRLGYKALAEQLEATQEVHSRSLVESTTQRLERERQLLAQADLEGCLAALRKESNDRAAALQAAFVAEKTALHEDAQQRVARLQQEHSAALKAADGAHGARLAEVRKQLEAELAEERAQHGQLQQRLKQELTELKGRLSSMDSEREALTRRLSSEALAKTHTAETEMKDSLTAAQRDKADMQLTIETLSAASSRAEFELTRLRDDLINRDSVIASLREDLAGARGQLSSAETRHRTDLKDAMTKMTEAVAERNRLAMQLQELQSEATRAAELELSLASLKSEFENQERALQVSLREHDSVVQDQKAALATELAELNRTHARELEGRDRDLESLRRDLQRAAEQLEFAQKLVDRQKEKDDALRKADQQTAEAELKNVRQALDLQIAGLKSAEEALTARLTEERERSHALQEDLAKARRATQDVSRAADERAAEALRAQEAVATVTIEELKRGTEAQLTRLREAAETAAREHADALRRSESQRRELAKTNAQLRAEAEAAETQALEQTATIGKLQQQLAAAGAQQTARSLVLASEDELSRAADRSAQLQAKAADLEARLFEAGGRLATSEAQLSLKQAEIEKLVRETTTLHANLVASEARGSQQAEQLKAEQQQTSQLRDELTQAVKKLSNRHETELRAVGDQQAALHKEVGELTVRLQSVTAERDALASDNKEALSRLNAQHQHTHKESRAQHEAAVSAIQRQHEAALAAVRADAEHRLTLLEAQHASELDSSKKTIETLRLQLADADKRIAIEVQAYSDKLVAMARDHASQIEGLRQELSQQGAERARSLIEMHSRVSAGSLEEHRVTELQTRLATLGSQLDETRTELTKTQLSRDRDFERLERQAKEKASEAEALEVRVAQLQSRVDSAKEMLHAEVSARDQSIAKLESEGQAAHEHIHLLAHELETTTALNAELRAQLGAAKSAFEGHIAALAMVDDNLLAMEGRLSNSERDKAELAHAFKLQELQLRERTSEAEGRQRSLQSAQTALTLQQQEHAELLASLKVQYDRGLEAARTQHESTVRFLSEQHDRATKDLREDLDRRLADVAADHKAALGQLQWSNENLGQQVQGLQQRIDELIRERDELHKRQLQTVEREMLVLSHKTKESDWATREQALEARIRAVQHDADALKTETDALRERVAQGQAQLLQKTRECEERTTRVESLERDLARRQSDIADLTGELAQAKKASAHDADALKAAAASHRGRLESELQSARERVGALESRVKELVGSEAHLKSELVDAKAMQAALEAAADRARAAIAEFSEKQSESLKDLHGQLSAQTIRCNELESLVGTLQNKITLLQSAHDQYKHDCDQAVESLAKARAAHEKQLAERAQAHQDELAALGSRHSLTMKERTSEWERERVILKGDLEQADAREKNLRIALDDANAGSRRLIEERDGLQDEVQKLQRQFQLRTDELEAALGQSKAALAKCRADLADAQEAHQRGLQTQAVEFETRLRESSARSADLWEQLKRDHDDRLKAADAVRTQLKEQQSEQESALRERLKNLSGELETARKELSSAHIKYDTDVQAAEARHRREVQQLSADLKGLREQLDAAVRSKDEATSKLSSDRDRKEAAVRRELEDKLAASMAAVEKAERTSNELREKLHEATSKHETVSRELLLHSQGAAQHSKAAGDLKATNQSQADKIGRLEARLKEIENESAAKLKRATDEAGRVETALTERATKAEAELAETQRKLRDLQARLQEGEHKASLADMDKQRLETEIASIKAALEQSRQLASSSADGQQARAHALETRLQEAETLGRQATVDLKAAREANEAMKQEHAKLQAELDAARIAAAAAETYHKDQVDKMTHEMETRLIERETTIKQQFANLHRDSDISKQYREQLSALQKAKDTEVYRLMEELSTKDIQIMRFKAELSSTQEELADATKRLESMKHRAQDRTPVPTPIKGLAGSGPDSPRTPHISRVLAPPTTGSPGRKVPDKNGVPAIRITSTSSESDAAPGGSVPYTAVGGDAVDQEVARLINEVGGLAASDALKRVDAGRYTAGQVTLSARIMMSKLRVKVIGEEGFHELIAALRARVPEVLAHP
eukprot:m.6104 g.6104  ORF g.6104 m.6104 type:complete len:2718 (+) comp2066_c0_seq1:105-8258(+)